MTNIMCVRCQKVPAKVVCDSCKRKDYKYIGVPDGTYTAEDLYRKRDMYGDDYEE